jgi:hypothetical protein
MPLIPVKTLFRRRYLKKFRSKVPTGITPLSQIRNAVTFIDASDPSFDKCKNEILSFYRDHNIHGEIFFFDFRRIEGGERLITSITNTILKRDLDWTGKPNKEKIDLMQSYEPDIFISLIPDNDFPITVMATCSTAKFKVGRVQIPGDVFDMVVKEPAGNPISEADMFKEMRKMIETVK